MAGTKAPFEFEWQGAKRNMGRLELTMMDSDFGKKDDRMGSASINLAALGVLDDGFDPIEDHKVSLNTRGFVYIRIDWRTFAEDAPPASSAELEAASTKAFMQEFQEDEEAEPISYKAKQLLPWTKFLRTLCKIKVKLTVKAGYNLLAADRGGTSDPYVIWQMKDESKTTKTIRKTINPVWEETFEVDGEVREFLAKPIRFEVFDDDKLSKDDSIGTALVTTETLEAVIIQTLKEEEPEAGREFWLKLNTKGYLGIILKVDVLEQPTAEKMATQLVKPIVDPAIYLYHLPASIRRQYSTATIRITLKSGAKLPAADGPSVRGISVAGAGTSDPYVTFKLGPEHYDQPLGMRWEEARLPQPSTAALPQPHFHSRTSTTALPQPHFHNLSSTTALPQPPRPLPPRTNLASPVPLHSQVGEVPTGVQSQNARLTEAIGAKYKITNMCGISLTTEINFKSDEFRSFEVTDLTEKHYVVAHGRYFKPIAPLRYKSSTVKKTLNPTWNEPFEFTAFVKDLTAAPLDIEVFDADEVSSPSSLSSP